MATIEEKTEKKEILPFLPENVVNGIRVLKNRELRTIMIEYMKETISKYKAASSTGNYARTYLTIALAGADRCERTEKRYSSFLEGLERRRARELDHYDWLKKKELGKMGSLLNFLEESLIKRLPTYIIAYLIIPTKLLSKMGINEVYAAALTFSVVVPSWESFLRLRGAKKEIKIIEKYNELTKGILERYDERITAVADRKRKEKEKIYSEALLGARNAYNVFILGKEPVFDLTGRVKCLEEHVENGKGEIKECIYLNKGANEKL